jgi:hypothetical protein
LGILSFSKKQFYLNTPDGDLILAEIFQEEKAITILLGGEYRIDLDTESALELADTLLLLTDDEGTYDE